MSADAEVNEDITPTFADILVGADAGAVPIPDVTWYAAASASDNLTFATAGPQRPGFIALFVNAVGEHGGEASAEIGGYGFSDPMLPFELGSIFQVSLSANATPGGCEFDGCTQAAAEVRFSLTEADGITPVSFFEATPPAPAPEPASWKFLLFGLAVCAAFYLRFRKAGSGSLDT